MEQIFGTEHLEVAEAHLSLAETLFKRAKFDEAEREARWALKVASPAEGEAVQIVANARGWVGHALAGKGDHQGATAEYQLALRELDGVESKVLIGELCDDLATSREASAEVGAPPKACAAR